MTTIHAAPPGVDPMVGAAPLDAAMAIDWIRRTAAAVHARREYLNQLDRAIGDGDHGTNLDRGLLASTGALWAEPPASVSAVLAAVGRTLVSTVGGASGPLYAVGLRSTGRALEADGDQVTAQRFGAALREGLAAIERLGEAEVGDKTIIDAFGPAVMAFADAADSGRSFGVAAVAADRAAARGAEATTALVARTGRAAYVGERSAGHQDPGATSTSLLFHALAEASAAP